MVMLSLLFEKVVSRHFFIKTNSLVTDLDPESCIQYGSE